MHRLILALVLTAFAAAPGNADTFADRKEQCVACHGGNGVSPTPETPS